MSLGPVLDVAIGLIFVYLLMGLITTASQELIANWQQWRGTLLKQSIADLLGNGNHTSTLFLGVFGHGLVKGASGDRPPSYLAAQKFALAVVDTLSAGSKAPVFTQVENSIGQLPAGSSRESLMALVRDAAGDLDALKTGVAAWYDDAMDRLSGVYKRRSQVFAIVFGFVAAALLNVDSIRIANELWYNSALRENMVAAASAYAATHTASGTEVVKPNKDAPQALDVVQNTANKEDGKDTQTAGRNATDSKSAATEKRPPSDTDKKASNKSGNTASKKADKKAVTSKSQADNTDPAKELNKRISELTTLRLPIGWDDAYSKVSPDEAKGKSSFRMWITAIANYFWSKGPGGALLILAGWLLTGIATSFGAPFWFDALKNVLNVRAAGPKPPRADAQGAAP